jgi:hypothetical protein
MTKELQWSEVLRAQFIVAGLIPTLCSLIIACSTESPRRAAADRAIKALRRVEAATDIGTNQVEYNSRVADAKIEIDNVTSDIEDPQINTELFRAIEAYTDAAHLWSAEPAELMNLVVALREKYDLPRDVTGLDRRADVQIIWKAASAHINEASRLNEK